MHDLQLTQFVGHSADVSPKISWMTIKLNQLKIVHNIDFREWMNFTDFKFQSLNSKTIWNEASQPSCVTYVTFYQESKNHHRTQRFGGKNWVTSHHPASGAGAGNPALTNYEDESYIYKTSTNLQVDTQITTKLGRKCANFNSR